MHGVPYFRGACRIKGGDTCQALRTVSASLEGLFRSGEKSELRYKHAVSFVELLYSRSPEGARHKACAVLRSYEAQEEKTNQYQSRGSCWGCRLKGQELHLCFTSVHLALLQGDCTEDHQSSYWSSPCDSRGGQ